jgi:3-methylcrotonyl-CoA carboxylase alpha subunit
MEMNTRLQVEHPVTEMVTGLDLVEWQLRVADGETLPLEQHQVSVQGHAMEARIYAEDTEQGFLPSTGRITYLRTPVESAALRIDTGVIEGSEISPYYDPMIAKLIVHGNNREDARHRLVRALGEFRVAGPRNNLAFLYNIASLRAFADVDLDTHFIERHGDALLNPAATLLHRDLAAAAVAVSAMRREAGAIPSEDSCSPWRSINGWRVNMPHRQAFDIHCHGEDHRFTVQYREAECVLLIGDTSHSLRGQLDGDRLQLELDGHRFQARLARGEREHILFWEEGACTFSEKRLEVQGDMAVAAGNLDFTAPMHGTVVALSVEPGTTVDAGNAVIVLEAMKMEQTLRAPVSGVVNGYLCAPGDMVDKGAMLVDFSPVESEAK